MPICDLDTDIKPWLGIDPAETKYDTTLTIIRDSVERSVLNYVESVFAQRTVTELYDGGGSDSLAVRGIPIVSVTDVILNVNLDGTGGSALDATSYYLPGDMEEVDTYDGTGTRGSSAILFRGIKLPRNRGIIRVDYTYGYDGVPPDIKHSILLAVEAEFRRKGRKTIGTSGRSKKDESERFSNPLSSWDKKTGLPQEVVYKLNPYRAIEFPVQPMATFNR